MRRARARAPITVTAVLATIASSIAVTSARADSPETPTGARAVVVLVGATAQTGDLPGLLTELLGRDGIAVEIVREPTFRAADLLAPGDGGRRSVSVFIEVPSDRVARLSFRGPRAERFLLRELGLRDGLDDVGREAVAQVVESSIDALMSFSLEGMSRDEARATLASAPSPPPAPGTVVDRGPRPAKPAGTPAAPEAAGTVVATGGARGAVAAWRGWLAARYSAVYEGPDLGVGHGPGLEAGLERSGPRVFLRARLVGERRFAQVITSPELDADVQDDVARLLIDLGWAPGAKQALAFGVGFGIDAIAIQPGAARAPDVTPAAATTHVVPVMRTELRYEVGGDAWRAGVVLFADVSLYATHYDLARADTVERLATPWPVRPGAAVVFGWRL
jgi:hypothetical protein